MPTKVKPDGPAPARIMIVGEAPGADEERLGVPFVGYSGQELTRMLAAAGIARSECFVTNVARERPPGNDISEFFAKSKKAITASHVWIRDKWVTREIKEGIELLSWELKMVQPNIIIALGNTALWALTGRWGITKWRGSMLTSDLLHLAGASSAGGMLPAQVIPTYHPAAILRQWSWRAIAIHDLRRAARFRTTRYSTPDWQFTTRPSYVQVIQVLNDLIHSSRSGDGLRVAFDIETRANHIACAGLAWSKYNAICIPFMQAKSDTNYWSLDEEANIVWLLYQLLTDSRVSVVGQNLLFDAQYTYRHWHFVPHITQDTMVSQHSLFSDLPKGLDFLASMYADYYVWWKGEGKQFYGAVAEGTDEGVLWYYNCLDCVYTFEVADALKRTANEMGLSDVHNWQQRMFWPVLRAMLLGIRIDIERRKSLILEVQSEIAKREAFLADILGSPLNPDSPKQMHALFYTDLAQPVQLKRGKPGEGSRPTLDDDALQKIAQGEPLLRPIVNAICDIRTLGKFLSNFLLRRLDEDARMRCSFNIGGSASGKSAPKTYRLSSSENAFGGGANLQNIPSEKSKSIGKAAARGGILGLGDPYQFPNIRSIFIPDPGYTWFDMDLERADLFVVCWEAEDEQLKAAMRLGVDIHLLNAFVITGKEPPPLEELAESHPRYRDHRGPQKLIREFAKVFCHGCVDSEHEVLSKRGWYPVGKVPPNTEILVCDEAGDNAKFEIPTDWWVGPCDSTMIEFEGEAINQVVTWDHKLSYRLDQKGPVRVSSAKWLPKSARLPKSVLYDGPIEHPQPELLAALHADGSIDNWGNVYWHFRKHRKISRLETMLTGFDYSRYDEPGGTVRFYLPRRQATELGLDSKIMPSSCIEWSHRTAVRYLTEQVHWDGHLGVSGGRWMSSVDERRAKLCHTLAHLHGFGSQLHDTDRTPSGRQRLYQWSLNSRREWRLSSAKMTERPGHGQTVYCPKTSTGFWLTRRKGKISITGNTNYGGGARTMAGHTGRTVAEIDRAQKIWFGAHPGIKRWHDRVHAQITKHHFVENRFGYRWYIFDRVDSVVPEAIAWIPQSTVSIVINRIWQNLYDSGFDIQVLLQVHDSLAGQFPTQDGALHMETINRLSRIVVPYPDPLIIPTSIKVSQKSWGDC